MNLTVCPKCVKEGRTKNTDFTKMSYGHLRYVDETNIECDMPVGWEHLSHGVYSRKEALDLLNKEN